MVFDLGHLPTLVAALRAIQFVASVVRNWREAIRLVPIGSVTPSMVNEYKTVPLCFVGGETVFPSIVTQIYGRLWIAPGARKQAVLCDQVVFLNRDRTVLRQQSTLEAGMLIQAAVSEGENSRHIRRCTRYCSIGGEVTLAMLFPTLNREQYEKTVRCVTVRSRARLVQDTLDRVPTRLIEWEVIDPSGIGASTDLSLEHDQVSKSALWLVSKEVGCVDDPVRARTGRKFYAFGSNRWRGFLSWCVTRITKLSTIMLAVIVAGMMAINAKLTVASALFILAVMVIVIYKCSRYMVMQVVPERFRAQAPTVREKIKVLGLWRGTVYHELEWHGSTRRSLAVGNRIRRVGIWQKFVLMLWEPLVNWVEKRMRHRRRVAADHLLPIIRSGLGYLSSKGG